MLMKPLVVQVQLENVYDEDDEEEDDLDDPKFIKSKSTQECGKFLEKIREHLGTIWYSQRKMSTFAI